MYSLKKQKVALMCYGFQKKEKLQNVRYNFNFLVGGDRDNARLLSFIH